MSGQAVLAEEKSQRPLHQPAGKSSQFACGRGSGANSHSWPAGRAWARHREGGTCSPNSTPMPRFLAPPSPVLGAWSHDPCVHPVTGTSKAPWGPGVETAGQTRPFLPQRLPQTRHQGLATLQLSIKTMRTGEQVEGG